MLQQLVRLAGHLHKELIFEILCHLTVLKAGKINNFFQTLDINFLLGKEVLFIFGKEFKCFFGESFEDHVQKELDEYGEQYSV